MATIKEDYVSFETAKLLKEKGFDEDFDADIVKWYNVKGEDENLCSLVDFRIYKCPSLAMAMKWLREKYNIYISIQPDFPSDKDYKICWCWSASILHENCISTKGYQCYIETYEEATEAAIKYCLEHLI